MPTAVICGRMQERCDYMFMVYWRRFFSMFRLPHDKTKTWLAICIHSAFLSISSSWWWYDRLNLSEKPFLEIRRRWRNANCHLNIATPSEIVFFSAQRFLHLHEYIRDEHGDISIYSLLFSPSRKQQFATMKLVWLVLLALICDVVLSQASTTTLTYLVKTTTTTTSTHQVNALCASYVSVTGPCRRRKNIWLNDPQLIFAYDQELRRIFNPTQVHS